MTRRTRMTRGDEQEIRDVRVQEPGLTRQTNEDLTDEVRDVVGRDHVRVPAGRPRPSRGEASGFSAERTAPSDSFVFVQIGAAAVVVGAIIALASGQWWLLPVAALVLFLITYGVVQTIMRMTSRPERPSPTTAAAMREEGVRDPERHFSAIVDEFTENTAEGEARTAAAEEDGAHAAAEHRRSGTPTGGPSQPVGVGRPEDPTRQR